MDSAPDRLHDRMPRWVWKAVAIFWLGALAALAFRDMWTSLHTLFLLLLVSLFLSFSIEPGVNRLARRGWRRGTATTVILLGVTVGFLVFIVAIVTAVGQNIADLLGNSEKYVNNTVRFLNDNFHTKIDATKVIDSINNPKGPVKRFIDS
ncbi:MAG: AI-2E family transporter, partial [Actinobacteria bacterium]|nr:AI-2E family transporter [Actinomycetota bacterium]